MLPDVGMVQMYSKSANVNDLHVFCMDRLPPLLHRPALLFVSTVLPPSGLPCPSETHCTIPTSALVFGDNTSTHLYRCKQNVRYPHCTNCVDYIGCMLHSILITPLLLSHLMVTSRIQMYAKVVITR